MFFNAELTPGNVFLIFYLSVLWLILLDLLMLMDFLSCNIGTLPTRPRLRDEHVIYDRNSY